MLIFLDRSEEAAVCFANTLHGRHPPPEAQVALLHLRTSCPDGSVHEVTESMHLDGMDASRVTSNRYLASCRTSVSDDRRREILRTIVSGLRNDERGGSFCALPRSSQRDCVHPSVDDFFCHTSLQGRSAYPGRLLRHGYVIRRPLLPQDDAGSRAGGQRPTHCLGGALLSCDAPSRGLVICVTRSVTADIPTGT